jgi:hypothetical protein
MTRLDAYARLQRAAALACEAGGDRIRVGQAWEQLRGLRSDEFPAEMRPAFSFLQHEISRASPDELSDREISFLTEKLRSLERMWSESFDGSVDRIGYSEAS